MPRRREDVQNDGCAWSDLTLQETLEPEHSRRASRNRRAIHTEPIAENGESFLARYALLCQRGKWKTLPETVLLYSHTKVSRGGVFHQEKLTLLLGVIAEVRPYPRAIRVRQAIVNIERIGRLNG